MILREMARRQSSPCTGKFSARPAGQPGDFFVLENLRRPLPWVQMQAQYRGASVAFCRHGGIYLVRCGLRIKPNPGAEPAASRRSARSPGSRTCREDHALSHRPQMSSGRLFLDRVGRHQSPSPLHRHPQNNMAFSEAWAKGDVSTLPARGHFYFALTSTHYRLACILPKTRKLSLIKIL